MGSVQDLAASLEQETQLSSIMPFPLAPDFTILALTQGQSSVLRGRDAGGHPGRVAWKSVLYQQDGLTVVGPFCSPDPKIQTVPSCSTARQLLRLCPPPRDVPHSRSSALHMVSCCPLGTGSTVYILGLPMSLSPHYCTVGSPGSASFANNPTQCSFVNSLWVHIRERAIDRIPAKAEDTF